MTAKHVRVPRALSRTGFILLLGSLSALGPFTIDTYLPAFGQIASSFHTDVASVGLSLSSYFLGICIGQIVYGPVLDRFGRRRPLVFGIALFAIASALCGLSTSIHGLVALRFVQALGGCVGMVGGRALVRDRFPDEQADIFSSIALVLGMAPIVAPSLGTWIAMLFGWRAIFGFLVAVSSTILVVLVWKLPEGRAADKSHSLHPVEVAKSYMALLRHREFLAWGVSGSVMASGLFAYIAAAPGVYMDSFGLSKTTFGWLFALNSTALLAASQLNRKWLRTASSERIVWTAVTMQGGAVLLLGIAAGIGNAATFSVILWAVLFFQGFHFPNSSALAMRPFGRNAGTASALMGSLQMACGAVISGLESLFPVEPPMAMVLGLSLSTFGGMGLLVLAHARRSRVRKPLREP